MKQFMLNKLTIILALFSIVGGGNAWAQLTELTVGGVYHFTNVSYTAKAMAATTPSSTAGVTADNTNKAQLWYVEDSEVKDDVTYYSLRNLGYGTYLQGNGTSGAWTLANTVDPEKSWFALTAASGKTAIRSYSQRNNGSGYAHIDSGSNIVGWNTGSTATQWNVEKIGMSSEDIQTALGIFDNVASYQTTLDALFSDKACTTLNGSVDESSASFQALPTTLQNMVRKVAGGDAAWTEANKDSSKPSWDYGYAKKYRVQLYEPYNDAGQAASALGLNAHNSLNNPTGIFANKDDVLYVMVDGEIKEGASLYLAYYTGHGKLDASSKVGYELKQGLNVIPVYQNSSNFCVNYVVQTFDTSDGKKGNKAKARRLSEYAPIKIHIEGGYINGYYNKVGDALYPADKNANWDYIEARATQTDVTVLGKYVTLQFPLKDEDTYDGDNNKNKGLASIFNDLVEIEKSIDEWDNVMLWERLLLGVLDSETTAAEAKKSPYSVTKSKDVFEYTGNETDGFESGFGDYYNIHGLSLGTPTGYMYGGWDHCGYHYNTMQSILVNMTTESGPHWGPGHEIGHQHQALLTVNGLTEVTNNLFSNVVLWYFGETTSRYNGTEGALSNVLAQFNAEGTDFFSNNIWAQTIMYYKLFLYYHVLGHNPKFYPRLFEMLRQDPMSGGYKQDGSKCLMHFYKKCCLAAGEDLTEFFRAHGFFEVMDNRLVGDYSNSVYTLTQEQINTAIKEVKDLGYKENISVLFITDATSDEILSHKDGVGTLTPFGAVCGEFGSYSTFNNNTEASYTYNISGTTVTMDGSGGVGFAILNENGELIGFSDKKTFELSPEAADAIVSGKASIVTVQADNTRVDAVNIMDSGDDDTRHQLLGNLLDDAKVALDCSDDTGKKVGFYRASALEDLQDAYDTAKGVYDAKTASAYSAVYDVLFQEYTNLINNEYARIEIIDGAAYRLTNKAYSTLNMAVFTEEGEDKYEMLGLTADESSEAQIWYFEPGTTAGTYYLKNKSTLLYPASAGWGAVLKADKQESTKGEKGGAAPYTLHDMGNGVFALNNGYGLHCSSSQSYNIVGWVTDADATQWYITAVELDNALEARLKLEETIEKTAALVDEMADAVAIQKFKLQNDDLATPFYISTNACYNTLSGKTDGQGLSGLLDEETSTYFHSDYSGNAKGTHYLQVDLGESHNVGQFKFNYATRDNGKNCPTAILVEGSADGTTFNQLATYTAADDALPNGNALSWESPVISNSNNYRYLRFSVTATENSKAYFVMSTFGITNPTPLVTEIKDGFVGDVASNEALKAKIVAALTELAEAQQLVDGAKVTEGEYNQQNSALNTHYDNLLTVYNKVKDAEFNAKKTELQTLINNTTALISDCGSVTYNRTTETGITLYYDAATNYPYLSCSNLYGANGSTNGGDNDYNCEHLLDGNPETWIHTNYNAVTSTYPHYLQVDFGPTEAAPEFFKFTYTTRSNSANQVPKTIVVKGSNDGENFDAVLATFSSDDAANALPTTQNTTWISADAIEGGFRYLRFYVTKSAQGTAKPYFAMSMFGMTKVTPENYDVTINPNMGEVDETLMVNTFKETAEAQSTYDLATTEQQVVKAIAQLKAQYDALEAAKNVVDKSGLVSLIQTATTKLTECGTVTPTPNGEVLDVTLDESKAGSVNKEMLRALYRAIKTAEGVRDNADATQDGVNAEIEALTEKIEVVETAQSDPAKANLQQEIAEMENLLTACATAPGSASQQLIVDCQAALQTAKDVYNADDTTVKGYADAVAPLNTMRVALSEAKESPAKADLEKAIDVAQAAIDSCASSITLEGDKYTVVWKFETAGDVDKATLITAYEALVQANEVYNGNASTVSEYQAAKEALGTRIATLREYKDGRYKAMLGYYVSQVAELIANCEETHGDLTDDMYADIVQRHTTATEYLTREFATQAELVNAITPEIRYIEGNIEAWNKAQQSNAKASLRTMIARLAELIEKCSVKGKNIVTTPVPCELQTSPGADFYISTNATDSEGEIQNLVDGDTNTFFQTKSSVGVEHYLLVDAGENNKLKKFTFSYRPCKSPFPYTIVVYGSNDNSKFTELATFTDLPTTDDQNWESSEIGNGTAYRYLRFNITKSGVAIKVDDNKELDTSVGEQLSNKYKSTLSAATPQVEYCFAMSEFDITNIVEEEEDIDILAGTVTAEQLERAASANTAAETLANTSAVKAELEAKTVELQTLYNELYAAYGLKVTLTLTDATRDKLLTGIDLGRQTIGTFSARYATLIPDGVTAYYATQEYSGGIVWLTRVENNILPANQGVILIGEEDYVNFYPAAEEPQEDLSQNIFSNTASGPVTAGSRDFILAKNETQGIGIYKAKEGITIGKGKAFIRLGAAAATQKLVLRFGGTTTDVDDVPTVILPEDTIYDLSGRRVNEVTKGGVYIVNGKKVFIK